MATLTLRDIPDELMLALKSVAKRERRSINAEGIQLLESSLHEEMQRERRRAALARIGERRARRPASDLDVVAMIREDRDR
jgi:plasmid stability protein